MRFIATMGSLALAIALAAPAGAQTAAPQGTTNGNGQVQGKTNGNGHADGAARTAPRGLSRAQLANRGDQKVVLMRETYQELLRLLERAQNDHDAILLNCVNEKLAQSKSLMRLGEEAAVGLHEAVADGDLGEARHQYTRVAVAADKVVELRAAARACIGELGLAPGNRSPKASGPKKDVGWRGPNFPSLPPVAVRPPPASQSE